MALEVSRLHVTLSPSGHEAALVGTVSLEGTPTSIELVAVDVRSAPDLQPFVTAERVEVTAARGERWEVSDVRAEGVEVRSVDGEPLVNVLRSLRNEAEPTHDMAAARPSWMLLAEGGEIRLERAGVVDPDGPALSELRATIRRGRGSRFHTTGDGTPRGAGRVSWDLSVEADTRAIGGRLVLAQVPLSVLAPFLPTLPLHEPERALVSADLRTDTVDGTVISFDGSVGVHGLGLVSPRIASAPVSGIDLHLRGAARWRRDAHTLIIEQGELGLGAARAQIRGSAMLHGDDYAFDLRAELPLTPCDVAVHAIPAGLLQDLTQARLAGSISGRIEARIDSQHLSETQLRIQVSDRCQFLEMPPMADVTRFQRPFLHQVLEPNDTVFEMETGPGTDAWTPLLDVSPFAVHAVLAHEDAAFFTHAGFAPWAIRDALVRNLEERRYVLGASTITMQLAKNVFLRREKTLARKVQEVLLTWWLERTLTKEQILELYLNVIEYGPGVYGIRSAAQHYFGRSPVDLSVAESAYLAMILPNPPMFHEHFEAGQLPPAFRRRVERFVMMLHERGRIDAEALAQGLEELGSFRFATDGMRVGPAVLRGTATTLPIPGFSESPGIGPSDPEAPEEGAPSEHDGWEEVWP
ncbi:MAG: hypothetical protein OHK0013_31310 [Sandaracinaceae bacterium]